MKETFLCASSIVGFLSEKITSLKEKSEFLLPVNGHRNCCTPCSVDPVVKK